jgi:hypothetical protein
MGFVDAVDCSHPRHGMRTIGRLPVGAVGRSLTRFLVQDHLLANGQAL